MEYCPSMEEILTIRTLAFGWVLLSGLDTLERDHVSLRVISLQFKAKCKSQKTFQGAYKQALICCPGKREKPDGGS